MLEEARIARSHELTTGAAIMAATQTLRSN
jgi:hypothetical protein